MIRLYLKKELLARAIKSNCGPVILTQEDLLSCIDLDSGLASHRCESLIARKIQESADTALAKTLGVTV
jgi:hypothetical protein